MISSEGSPVYSRWYLKGKKCLSVLSLTFPVLKLFSKLGLRFDNGGSHLEI